MILNLAPTRSMTSATIFPDTTILIQYQRLDQVDWEELLGVRSVKLMLAPSVLQEMEEIKNQDISKSLAKRASHTLELLHNMLEADDQSDNPLTVVRAADPMIDFDAEGLDQTAVADSLVASVISHQKTSALEYILLLTDDQETTEKALYAGIEVNSLPENYLLSLQEETPQPVEIETQEEEKSRYSSPLVSLLTKPSVLFAKPKNKQTQDETEEGVDDKELSTPKVTEPPETNVPGDEKKQEIDSQEVLDETPTGIETNSKDFENALTELENDTVSKNAPPFIDIIQEPARPDTPSLQPPLQKAPSELSIATNGHSSTALTDSASVQLEETEQQKSSFSFVSQAPSTNNRPPTAPFIPAETTEEAADIRLCVGENESRTTVTIHHPIYPSLDEVNSHLSGIRTNFPKLKLPFEASGGDGVGNGLLDPNVPYDTVANDTILQRKVQRIKKYNASLDTYYSGIEKYLSDVAEFENFRRRSAQLNLVLFNDLPESLKSLYISIHFPGNVRVYYEDNLPEKPITPPPPEEPDLDMLFDPIRLPFVPVPNELSSVTDLKMRGRNPAPLEVRWNKGWDVIYSIREIDRNTQIPFNPLFITFNSFDHATSFRINYRITVASASYEQLGDLEIVVRKEI